MNSTNAIIFLKYFLIFMTGASFASFLSVFEELGLKIFSLSNRSVCDLCKKQLSSFSLIPVFASFVATLQTPCCKGKISYKYLFSELFFGLWVLISFLKYHNFISFLFLLGLGIILTVLILEDMSEMQVSQSYLISLLILCCVYSLYSYNVFHILLSLAISLPFWLIYLISSGKAVGKADPIMYTGLNMFFGAQYAVSLFLYSVWMGAFWGIFYLYFVNGKFEKNVKIAFVPIISLSVLFILTTDFHIIKISDILVLNDFFFKK